MQRQEVHTERLKGKIQLPVRGFSKHLWTGCYICKPLAPPMNTGFMFLPFISK